LQLTGSPRAAELLGCWERVRDQFVRVAPRGVKVEMNQAWIRLRERVLAQQG
jgi:hypothetical protein